MKIKKRFEPINLGLSNQFNEKNTSYFKLGQVFLLVLFICLSLTHAAIAKMQEAKTMFNLSVKQASLVEALTVFEKETGCIVNYSNNIFNASDRVSVSIKSTDAADILRKILQGTRVAYKMADHKTFLLYKLPDPIKPGRVTGKVLDEKGEFLPGASIKVVENGRTFQSATDGSYTINLEPGTYTLDFSFVSYFTKRVEGIVILEDKATPLDVALKPNAQGLKEVVVVANYKKASVEGLLTRQKNASEISNGISSEQISRTPDRNIGESLKRISGVNTVENKLVIVRGIGERYNTAQLDGTILPSSEAQSRNFSFDLIPSNLVDNVVVSKTYTPDMNASFAGGLIQINTKDIPAENFISFSVGSSFNDQSTGKEFLSHKRGKYDYLGYDDGRRKFPTDLKVADVLFPPPGIDPKDPAYLQGIVDQSKRFTRDNFSIWKYDAAPGQNYQFSTGRLIDLDTTHNKQLGFTAALSYRNSQNIINFDQQRRLGTVWSLDPQANNYGSRYSFNTTWGALLNVGFKLGNNRFSFRNTFTHLFANELVRTIGYDNPNGSSFIKQGLPNLIREADDPTFTDLLQNKLSGQHQVGAIKLEWNVARTSIERKEKDLIIADQGLSTPTTANQPTYYYLAGSPTEVRFNPLSRHNYRTNERHYSWSFDASMPFNFGNFRDIVKVGYFGLNKKGTFDWQIAALSANAQLPDSLRLIPIQQMVNPANFSINSYFYSIPQFYLNEFAGKSTDHAFYAMLDNRLNDKFRLVWGLRANYFKYTEIKNPSSLKSDFFAFNLPNDKRWQWLPSANFTYSPINSVNIRLAFAKTIIRPELMDNSRFFRYDPVLGGQVTNAGLISTKVNNYDFKAEWFPGLGEIISAGAFYKKFKNPVEQTFNTNGDVEYFVIQNSSKADVYGFEFELRKNLGFIYDNAVLKNLYVSGNLTLQQSKVVGTYAELDPNNPSGPNILRELKAKRPMYGQAPYLINLGLLYNGDKLGINIVYNKSGYKTFVVSANLNKIEFEMPRSQVDAQVAYKFLKKRLEVKMNIGNIFNKYATYYRNLGSYMPNPAAIGNLSESPVILKPGFSNKFEDGDVITFRQAFGRTYSTSLTYNF